MSKHGRIIVDANIAFRCLVAHRGDLRAFWLQRIATAQFYAPRYLFVELFKHKQRLIEASRLPEEDILAALYTLSSQIRFYNEALIPLGVRTEAIRLCGSVDEKDTPYVAPTLHLDAKLWTHDDELKQGLRRQGFDGFLEDV